MLQKLGKAFIIVAALGIGNAATGAWACTFNGDCAVGSKCLKRHGAIYGVCVGGTQPGNQHDREPVEKALDIDKTFGNTCSFDVDCGVKNKCVKRHGQMEGVCISRGRP